MRTINDILADYRATLAVTQEEEKQRQELMESEDYQLNQRLIDSLQKEQEEMLSKVPDSTEEYEADKQELIDYMQENNETKCEEFTAKGRKKRHVDVYATLQALQGDIDALMIVSSVKIGDLEKFRKENKVYSKELRQCIVEDGFVITDILCDL